MRKRKNRNLLIILGLIIGLVVAFLAYKTAFSPSSGGLKVDPSLVVSGEPDPTIGVPDAPIVIEEYSDFTCPHCAHFSLDVLPKLYRDYIKTGKVKFVFKPFLRTPQSLAPSLAALCAYEQDPAKFWEYHEKLFEGFLKAGPPYYNKRNFIALANQLGLDVEKFKQCYESQKYKEDLLTLQKEALERGVRATPTLFIAGYPIEGAPPYEDLKQLIDKALENMENPQPQGQ